MKKIVSIISGCLIAMAAHAAESSAPPVFQMRLVAEQASGETEEMKLVHKANGKEIKEVLLVRKTVLLDQKDLKSATVSTDPLQGTPQIYLEFTDQGTKRFAEVTRQSLGRRLAIIIDGQVYSAPNILTEIPNGKAQLTGSFSKQEARDLAAKITKALRKR